MGDTKDNFPPGYEPSKVWEPEQQAGKFGGMNRPTAGARSKRELPVGEHELQLYSLGTPNGQKVTILLEELVDMGAIPSYDAWYINIMELDQFTTGFTAICPNGKIPALADHSVKPPRRVFESGSILLYLAEKHRAFIPTDPGARTECLNWLFWQMGTAPFLGGGFGHFYKYAPIKIKYAIDRYSSEVKRQLDVLERHLGGVDERTITEPGEERVYGTPRKYMCGDEYTIADMAIVPWIRCIETGYGAAEFLSLDKDHYPHVVGWVDRVVSRPAAKRGLRVNGFSDTAVKNRHSLADFGTNL